MEIILVSGKKRAGKSYFSELLRKELANRGYTVNVDAFANPIKEILSDTLGISTNELDNFKNNVNDYRLEIKHKDYSIKQILFRQFIQKFGTEAMKRQFGEDVWAKLMLQRIGDKNVDFVIVSDFRFKCENIGGTTVKITNQRCENDDHRSENELNDFPFDYTIDNTNKKLTPQVIKEFVDDLLK